MEPKSLRVLLIEDDEDDYVLTLEALSDTARAEYEITWCEDPAQGLAELRSGTHDICLVDFRLGGVTGVELIEAAGDALRQTPAILLTGRGDTEVDIAGMKAGASDFLVKGTFDSESLERAIRYAVQRRDMDARLEHLAFHDPLTDLPNRLLFGDRVDQALRRQDRSGGGVAVIFFDIDNFKNVNDSHGHSSGDRLLRGVAGRIQAHMRPEDSLARLGGDEFAICIEVADSPYEQPAITVAERALSALISPFDLDDGVVIDVRASFGIALAAGDDEMTTDDLLRNADIAMYQAKSQGKDSWAMFHDEMHDARRRRTRLEGDLRDAVRRGAIDIVYQPFYDMATTRLHGFEALSRWTHEELGPQSPEEFIGIAEDSDIIISLGRVVLRTACEQCARWREDFGFNGFVSVNVSPRQLAHSGFIDTLNESLTDSGLDPEQLVIEITESVMTNDPAHMVAVLEKITEIGVRIALDDFGTGYSSLSHLHLLPVQIVKVDRSFIARSEEPDGRSMLAAIAAMASSLGLSTIAEGIETEVQLATLRAMGYDIGQGFLFGKGQPAEWAARHLEHDTGST